MDDQRSAPPEPSQFNAYNPSAPVDTTHKHYVEQVIDPATKEPIEYPPTGGGGGEGSGGEGGGDASDPLRPTIQSLIDSGVVKTPPWSPQTDFLGAQVPDWETMTFCKPEGSDNLFAQYVNSPGRLSGDEEPDWSSAPNEGDSVDDNDYTWYNIGPFAAWPPTPQTWTPGGPYTHMSAVWPTDPYGVVFMSEPGEMDNLPDGTVEPNWTDIRGGYVSDDNNGYWVAMLPIGHSIPEFTDRTGIAYSIYTPLEGEAVEWRTNAVLADQPTAAAPGAPLGGGHEWGHAESGSDVSINNTNGGDVISVTATPDGEDVFVEFWCSGIQPGQYGELTITLSLDGQPMDVYLARAEGGPMQAGGVFRHRHTPGGWGQTWTVRQKVTAGSFTTAAIRGPLGVRVVKA
jgi:hypothetical protein